MLWMFQRVNYGPVTNPKNEGMKDLSTREWLVLAPTVVMAVVMGVAPSIFLKPMKPALDRVIARMAAAEPSRVVSVWRPASLDVARDTSAGLEAAPDGRAVRQLSESPRERGAGE
jgi:NADH-quinone oxidoreductase subunit M